MLSEDNSSIYTLYENKILLKEFSPTTINTPIKDGRWSKDRDERLKRVEELKKLQ